MKKYFPMLLLTVFLTNLIWIPRVDAAEGLWQLFWAEDNALLEHLTIDKDQAAKAGPQWKKSEKSGRITLNREIKDWEAYQGVEERLPLKAQVSDYIVFRITTLQIDKLPANRFLEDISGQGCKVSIEVPGYIKENPVGEQKELTISWDLPKLMDMKQGDLLLQTYTVNAFYLAIVLFFLGFLVVGVFVAAKTRKIDRLIEERYSLDRIGEEDDIDYEK